ncbi:MAG: dihydrolipoamide dehydrogenase [Rhodospirillaceae bacterium]|nr:dihydrolipoamide dehydrogenase [Rhodospirillaceae bacterium]|tara:strand:- start:2478 stop:3908 length:1431 start_codon:yes stop_codon:yes gene_type:complete
MANILKPDICVIGGGAGGLSVAAAASQMGAKIVLVERGKMGGDCLNYGCVPSKATIAAAHKAHVIRESKKFGLKAVEPTIDFQDLHDHIHGIIAAIAPHDSVERFEGLGVTVIHDEGRFTGPREVAAGNTIIQAKKFIISTGSSADIPPIPGIDATPYLTNKTVFDLTEAPDHLIVVGGGPIGSELAQAHRRLGAKVTLLEMFRVLGKDDPEITEVVKTRMIKEGIDIRENIKITKVSQETEGLSVWIKRNGQENVISGSHLLITAGRSPNTSGLDLQKAGIKFDRRGIKVDARLRTSNKRVFAIGDVTGGVQFTHAASCHAGIIIRNILFKLPAKVNYDAFPWVTYTDPEIAHVGQTELQAKEKLSSDLRILRFAFAETDRAQAEQETDGMIKVITDKKGHILGCSMAGSRAGELILPWALAISQKMKIGVMASVVTPYPTLSEVSKRAAGSFYTPSLFSERTKKIVRFLLRLPF